MRNGKPLVIDGYCGLGGWSEAFIAEGWECVGIDIERHDYGSGGYPGELIIQDMRTVKGEQFKDADLLVFSPPCQEFSYMAMPWTKAKEKMRKILADPAEQARLNDLFNQCFRIQREVSEAAGHYVPMVIENVRGAQRWVGRAQAKFGSFYLWGDVPALMPIPGRVAKVPVQSGVDVFKIGFQQTAKLQMAGHKVPGFRFDGSGKSFQSASVEETGFKSQGLNWSDQTKRGQDFTRVAGKQAVEGVKMASESGRRADKGKGARFTSRDCGDESGNKGFKDFHDSPIAALGSKSPKRKEASALIAKIPAPLASWIARCFRPPTP